MTQTMEQEVSVMCNLSKGVREKGVAVGMTNGILFSIKTLMETWQPENLKHPRQR